MSKGSWKDPKYWIGEEPPTPNPTSIEGLKPIPIINGLDCPACGHRALMLAHGNYITCAIEECPNPDYSDALNLLISKREIEARRNEAWLVWKAIGELPSSEVGHHLLDMQYARIKELTTQLTELQEGKE